MAQNSKIEWTEHTANLWHGCTKVHEGCDNCYAETLAKRWGNDIWGNNKPRKEIKSFFNDLDKYQKLALEANERHRVFVGSMMDIFEKPMLLINSKGEEISYTTEDIRNTFFMRIMGGRYPNLIFLLLTKRPSNINKYIPESWKETPPENVWFGTSPVNQETADKLIPQLLEVKGNKFLSIEPMLDEIDMSRWLPECRDAINTGGVPFKAPYYWMCHCKCGWIGSSQYLEGGEPISDTGDHNDVYCPNCRNTDDIETDSKISWVICGGESGHHHRPFNLEWARSLRNQCEDANVPFFFKQIDKVRDKIEGIPEDLQIRQFPKF